MSGLPIEYLKEVYNLFVSGPKAWMALLLLEVVTEITLVQSKRERD